jgi:hypothetical protein
MSNPSPKKSEKFQYEISYEMKDMATSVWLVLTLKYYPREVTNLLTKYE